MPVLSGTAFECLGLMQQVCKAAGAPWIADRVLPGAWDESRTTDYVFGDGSGSEYRPVESFAILIHPPTTVGSRASTYMLVS